MLVKMERVLLKIGVDDLIRLLPITWVCFELLSWAFQVRAQGFRFSLWPIFLLFILIALVALESSE
jgi:hypothetical protein